MFAFDIERDDAFAAVERDSVEDRDNWRYHLFAADASQFLKHPFRVTDALDPQLVIDAENYRSTGRVGQRDYSLRDPFGVRKLDLKLEIRVLAAAYQTQQLRAGGQL